MNPVRIVRSWLADETFLELLGVTAGAAAALAGVTLGALSLLAR
jgi:hypothetical protein